MLYDLKFFEDDNNFSTLFNILLSSIARSRICYEVNLEMKYSKFRIPEDTAAEVFALASQYYAEKDQSYSVLDMVEAGAEVHIPPEFIQQAIQEIQTRQKRAKQQRQLLFKVGAGMLVAIALWSGWTYNSISNTESKVDLAWAQVENQLQRRADLIPKLIQITKAYAQQEQELVALLVESRQTYLQTNTPEAKLQSLQSLNRAIDSFWDYAATNSQLRSSQLYDNLQYELTGTENRIAVERMRYSQAVKTYNQKIQQFPNLLMARILGFQKLSLSQANNTNFLIPVPSNSDRQKTTLKKLN